MDSFLQEGDILFRNLPYFKKVEDGDVRGDILEGTHRDTGKNGDGGVMKLKSGERIKCDYFDNSIETDEKTFIFCLSKIYNEKLYEEFECDACVKIKNTKEFIDLCIRKLLITKGKQSKLYFNHVKYYGSHEDVSEYIKEPSMIPLLKREKYSYQEEFRLYYAIDDVFKIKKSITIKNSNPFNLPPDKTPKPEPTELKKIIPLGNIRPITEVIYKP